MLICTQTYALRLAETARSEGRGRDLPASPVRLTIHAGEPGASIPSAVVSANNGHGTSRSTTADVRGQYVLANLPAGAPVPAPVVPGTINALGGIPIKVGDQLIGAVSVSGAPGGDKDAACANAGLAKVADKLK